MQVAVLVIVYCGRQDITLHDDEAQGWSALLRFVHERWDDDAAHGARIKPIQEEDMVRLFFAAEGDEYILGSADLSEVEALVEAKARGRYPRF